MSKNLNVNLSFTADTTQAKKNILDLQNSLNSITSIGNTKLKLTDDMQIAVNSAKQLQMHLANALNTRTGNFDLNKLNASLKASNTSLATLGSGLLKAGVQGEQAFMNIQRSIATANVQIKQANGFLAQMRSTLMNTLRWQIASSALHSMASAVSSAVQYAEDLDKSLNNIRIVTGQNADQMAKFAKEANKAAKALSTTTTKYTDASLIYYQQGLSDEEVKKRTDVTVKMANVAGESVETISDQLTAVWNNFDDGSKSLEYYADVMTALGAATASSVDEITGGLEKFAAIGDTIGLSFEYAASALATITSNTRQSEEVVGTALKTIFARIQGLKLGETQEDGTNLNKYSEALAKVGISIFEANGELKAMDNILDEMAAKWDELTKAEQAALAQTVAGIRQYTQLIALMENWNNGDNDSMMANLNTSYDSTGTLQGQADIYAESWEAAQSRIKASLETLYNELIPTDFLISLTDAGSDILDGLSVIVDGFGGLGNILLLISNIALHKFAPSIMTGLNSGLEKAQGLIGSFQNLKTRLTESAYSSKELETHLNGITGDKIKTAADSLSYYDAHLKSASSSSLQMSQSLNQSALATEGLSEAFKLYLADTSQVYNLQALIEKNAKNLNAAEKERLSTMQQQLLVIANEKKELQTEISLLETQLKLRIQSATATDIYNAKGYKDRNFADVKGSKISVKKEYDQALTLYSDKNKGYGDWIDPTIKANKASFTSTSVDGIVNAGTKATQLYSNIETINAKINNILQQQGVSLKEQIAAAKQIVNTAETDKQINKEIQQTYIQQLKAVERSKSAQLDQNAAVEANQGIVQKLRLGLIQSGNEVRQIAQGFGVSDEHLKNVLAEVIKIVSLQDQQAGKQAEWNSQLNNTKKTLMGTMDKFKSMGGYITSAAQGFSTLTMGLSMASNAIKTLNDDTADFETKLTSIGFALPMLIQSFSTLSKLGKFLTSSFSAYFKVLKSGIDVKKLYLFILKDSNDQEELNNLLQLIGITQDEMEAISQALVSAATKKGTDLTKLEIALEVIKQNTKLKTIAILGAVVLATIAVIGITKALINAYNKEEEANKKAQEQLQATNQTLSNTKQKYQEVIDTINQYEESVKALDNIRKGTEEWDEAVQKLNSDILELLKSYSGLAQYISEDEDGVLSISDEGLDWLEEQQRQAVNKAEVASYNAAIAANNAEDDWNTTRIAREAGLTTTELEAGVKALQADPTLYASQGAELYDRISQALYGKNYMAGEETAGVIVAIANAQEEVTNLANELKANTKANEILGKQVSESYLKQSQDYLDANEDAQNAANLLLTNKLAGKDFSGRNGRTKMESYEDYARYMGWDVINIDKQKGYAEYTLADGSTEKVYLDIARQALNQQEYVDGIQDEINTFVNNIDKLERNIKTADDYQNYKSAITREGLAAGLTQDQITSVLYNSEQAGRFAKIDDITNEMLTKGLTGGISGENIKSFQKSLDELSDEELSLAIDVLPSSESLEEFKDNLHEAIVVAGRQDIENIFAAGEEELGISAEALESYAETLMLTEYQQTNFNELSQEGQRNYIENAKAAANAAVANYRLAIGINKVQKAFSDHIDVLTEGNEASLDFHEAIGELTIAMKEAFGMKVDAKFVKENLQLIKEMSEGSEQALVDLRNKLNEDFILKLEFEDNTLNQELLTTLEQLQQQALNNPVGTTLQLDNDKAIAALNEALITGQATIEDIQAMFNNANLQMPEYKTKSIPGDAVHSHSVVSGKVLGIPYTLETDTTTTTDRVVPYFGDNAPEVDHEGNITSYGGGGSLAVTTSGPASMSDLNEIIEYNDEDNADAIKDKNFENLQKSLELNLYIDESDLEHLEYLLDKYEDDFYKLNESVETLFKTIEPRENILETHENYISQLNASYEAGQISQEDYISGLENSKDAIYDQLNALLDLDKQMREYYGNTLNEADDELGKHTDHLENLTKVFDHYINLLDIFGKSKDYDTMGDFLEGQAHGLKNELDVAEAYYDGLVKEKEEVKKLFDEAVASGNEEDIKYYGKMYDDITDSVDRAYEDMLEKTEAWAESMKKIYENTFNKLSDELEKALTDGMGFDSMLNDFDLLNQQQEEFLTKTNQIYETNKLMRTATKAMDDTSNKAAKQKIKNYIEETKKLQNTTRLSKYELEIQQAKYDLLLAEIALEEAQNAKSTVRLTRDNEGNFGYVYTADQDEIDDAQQKYEDAQNNLYNIQYEGQQNALTKYVEALQDYYNAQTELQEQRADGTIASDEELKEKQALLEDRYFGPMGILTELSRLYNITLQENTNATAENLLNQYGFMTDGVANHANLVQQYIGEMDVAWADFQRALTLVHDDVQTALGDSEQATEDLKNESDELAKEIKDVVIPAIHDEIGKVREQVAAYGEQRNAILDLISRYEDYIKELDKVIAKELELAAAQGSGDDSKDKDTDLPNTTSSPSSTTTDPYLYVQGSSDLASMVEKAGGPPKNNYYGTIKDSGQIWTYVVTDNKAMTNYPTRVKFINNNGQGSKLLDTETRNGVQYYKLATENGDLWFKAEDLKAYNTGGYTGDWGPEGKLAMLHEKELVLNAADTSNILSAVSIIREIARDIDARASMSNLSLLTSAIGVHDTNQVLEQMVSIEASFPNATDRYEIEEAFNSLVNKAAQYANRK